jgi:glutathionyl-hydroquinone reductase
MPGVVDGGGCEVMSTSLFYLGCVDELADGASRYVTNVRFDVAYHTSFRFNLKTIRHNDPNIQR